ncbi:hemophore-related protein [Candidatus Mycolicibacterium alkanivorans]|uniref:Heme-binding protein n=1 Tax=Candidatus Mycolicibacterium alkanivorans TaxID=2954114 RepID=A0ABS9YYF0_9MYCO|nr:hemophore-related protein [Candidatus Mycolicibacterium alkanivorans]MCI4676127.1 heme-binding protein [Candidatus Mycolicibacterium alkanivorans]
MKTAELAGVRRTVGTCLSALVGGLALGVIAAPSALAAPDCSKVAVDNTVSTVSGQVESYVNSHPDGKKMLITASLQPRPQAEQTLRNYATANPQEYAEFKQLLSPLGTIQQQCGVQVVPPQYQWAFDAFIG